MSLHAARLPEQLSEIEIKSLPELKTLSPAWPRFSIPKLEERPQNPIISNLGRKTTHKHLPDVDFTGTLQTNDAEKEEHIEVQGSIWLELKDARCDYNNRLVSWDTMRSSYRPPKSSSVFFSEQAPDVAIAARNPHQLPPSGQGGKAVEISMAELYDALQLLLVGCASALYDWDASEERFVPVGHKDGRTRLLIDGLDGLVSDSYMSRFVTFGTLFRRLEALVIDLRKSNNKDDSATFAFGHCLSSVLAWIRREANCAVSGLEGTVCEIWISLQDVQSVLSAIASLCSRDIHFDPKSYHPVPQVPQRLLSHIYEILATQFDGQAPLLVRATLSYILTITSRPYFNNLGHSIGLVGLEDTLADARRKAIKMHDDSILIDQDDNGEDADSELELENGLKEEFPGFISEEMRDAILRARRSIRILSSPEFEGGQKLDLPDFRILEWVWTDERVSNRSLGQMEDASEPAEIYAVAPQQILRVSTQKYKAELANLAVFDLEPASFSQESVQNVISFISSYPARLPILAPTLPLLAEHVMTPVSTQARALGRAALQHFLSPGTSLHFRAHLVLLRAYLMLSAPAFKARLATALFSDTEEDEDVDEGAQENPGAITIRTRACNANWRALRARRVEVAERETDKSRPWPVGIAFGLTRQAEWPPGGSDLSFYLRRVIMDSLDDVRESEIMFNDALHKDDLGNNEFWDEAESRLGFAIRELPVGTGSEKWLDPTQIEALDFLYMQYKPPNPLRCLITEDILSKYQRIFAFLLRLLRVETAMRTVFRMTRPASIGRVFADYPGTQSLVLHFRFAAQAFLSSFSAYVADTAIRGNIDVFISRVQHAELIATSGSEQNIGPFVDVYALMQRHSRVLDAILAACLLRGAQRAVGDILRALLEVLLEFAVLVGNAYRSAGTPERNGSFDAERAAQRIEALYAKFCKTRNALVKALRKIAERGSKPFAAESSTHTREKLPPASGGMEALVDLLLRIGDMNDGKK